ncbi:FAD-dependent oxidoreductase, partial [Mesorhizobium sp. M0085]|uniref:FAD-dependent oxidoreductase n=1 Tax=Mesorhizobium sp. M0085 TaxID=2956872 RepID=UPI0033364811
MTKGMVIIGAGECGGRAALALRELGYDGPVTLVGDEPHLPYERPPLSKDAMVADAPLIKAIASEAVLAERSIRHIHSVQAVAIVRAAHVVGRSGGSAPGSDKRLLAAGSVARQRP